VSRRLSAHAVSVLIHVAAAVIVIGLRPHPQRGETMVVEYVSPEELKANDRTLAPSTDTLTEFAFDSQTKLAGALAIDLPRIRARRETLFPFVTLDLQFVTTLAERVASASARLQNPYATNATDPQHPPLTIADAELQRTIDDAWSRRHRWERFRRIAELVTSHAANSGQAPAMIRRYLDQNILQPYCDGTSRDARFWAMLENAADHADFIDFVRAFARSHPSSQTTTELLFLLDELAQGSLQVVLMLLETKPEADLAETRATMPLAYHLAIELKQYYGEWLFKRGMDKAEIRRAYDELRLRLLQAIVDATPNGYRAADARYLSGEILFNTRHRDEAYAMWRAITPVATDAYFRAYSEVLAAIGSAGREDVSSVRQALSNEYGRWRVFSIDRLRHFGHTCGTF
jgi:hypothetical protein